LQLKIHVAPARRNVVGGDHGRQPAARCAPATSASRARVIDLKVGPIGACRISRNRRFVVPQSDDRNRVT
jgi:hypothetical protein